MDICLLYDEECFVGFKLLGAATPGHWYNQYDYWVTDDFANKIGQATV